MYFRVCFLCNAESYTTLTAFDKFCAARLPNLAFDVRPAAWRVLPVCLVGSNSIV